MPVIKSKYKGTCSRCGNPYAKGDEINYLPKRVTHKDCYRQEVRFKRLNDGILIRFDYDADMVAEVKKLTAATWLIQTKAWSVAPTAATQDFLDKYNAKEIDASVEKGVINLRETFKLSQEHIVDGYPTLMKHQGQVINTIKAGHQKIYVGAPPGAGKTAMALIGVAETEAFPMLVVCPAIVKENWSREADQWIGMKSSIVSGRTVDQSLLDNEIVIINYDILEAWKDSLVGFGSVVIDESHYLKNPKAKRSIAAAEVIGRSETVIYLSGSPTPSSPLDLVVPLQSIGVLDLFGGFGPYTKRYCPPYVDRWGNVAYKKNKNVQELHRNLKKSCFVSWKKDEILDLPDLQEPNVPVDVKSNQFDDLVSRMKSATISEAMRVIREYGQANIKDAFSTARKETGLAKIDSIVEQTKLLAENDQVVTVVHHRDVNDAIVNSLKKKFKVGQIIGGGTSKQKTIDDFVSAKTQIMVMSITAGGIGINLQNSSVMVMGEVPATYAEYDQAISRQYRKGQSRGVVVYRMVAAGTTDDVYMNILNHKEKLHKGIMDGDTFNSGSFDNSFAQYLVDLKKKR